MKVLVYSIGRCGGTLVEQIAGAHSDIEIRPSHTIVRNLLRRKMIVPYRDFRSVLVSHWRTSAGVSMEELGRGRKMSKEEISHYTNVIVDKVAVMEDNLRRNEHALVLKYEEFFNNFEFLFNEIGSYLNRPYNKIQRKELDEKLSINANRKLAEKISTFEQWDRDGTNGNHVWTGEVNSWRSLVAAEDHKMFNSGLKDVLKRWGYSTLW